MNVLEEKITAIEKVHNEFLWIIQHEKCRTCSCLHTDMMASILNTIQKIGKSKKDDDRLTAAEKDFSKWIMDAGKIDLHQ